MNKPTLKETLAKLSEGSLNIVHEQNREGIIQIIFEEEDELYRLDGYEVKYDKKYFEKEPYKVERKTKKITVFS